MNRTTSSTLLTGVLLASSLAPGSQAQAELQAYLGPPALGGRIRGFAEGTGQLLPPRPELRGIVLLPLDFNGRLAAEELLPQRPQVRFDLPGVGRIELSNGLGVLYRYRRSLAGAEGSFGYLRIDEQGGTHLLAERPGTGPGAFGDPYGERVALAPDARSFLVATAVAAGGDLFEVDLETGVTTNRSLAQPPLEFLGQSLRRHGAWVVAVAKEGVFRAGPGAQDQLEQVPLEGAPSFYSGEVVSSPDSTRILTTAGSAAGALHAWVLSASGPAARASRDRQPMSGAGYLPEALHGPFLAVSNDGDLCAWRTEEALSREVYLRRASAPAAQPATHVTGIGNFTDTLEEAGVLNMFQPGKLMMAVGETGLDVGVGIEKADLFEVSLDAAGAPTLVNLSGTSGELSPPYLATPQLSPRFLRWVPAAGAYFFYDEQSGGTGRLAAFDPGAAGVQTILAGVKDVLFVELVGDTLIVSLRMDSGNKPHRLVRLPADLAAAPTVAYDAGDSALTHALVDASGWVAFTEVPELGPQRLHRYQLQGGVLESFTLTPSSFGPVLAWSPGGDLAFSFDSNGLCYFGAWPRGAGVPYRLRAVAADGALLPGR